MKECQIRESGVGSECTAVKQGGER